LGHYVLKVPMHYVPLLRSIFCLFCAAALQGCTVIAIADMVGSAAVRTVGAATDVAVGTARITGKVVGAAVGAAVDAAIPDKAAVPAKAVAAVPVTPAAPAPVTVPAPAPDKVTTADSTSATKAEPTEKPDSKEEKK
jgi:hypothetical protein